MEETSIPDELTYHEPAPHHAGEPRDALFMTARIVSLIFTPFMVPFVAFTFRTLCARLRFKSSRSISNASAMMPLVMSCSTHLVKSLRAI